MNYYDYLNKKLDGLKPNERYIKVTNSYGINPFVDNIFSPNLPALKIDGNSVFTSAKRDDVDKIDYTKLQTEKPDEEKELSPLEYILKEFLSINEVKEAADGDHNGDLTIDEIKEYIKELLKKDGNADELSLDDFEAVLKELGIDLEELSKPSEEQSGEEQAKPAEEVLQPAETPSAGAVHQPVHTPSAGNFGRTTVPSTPAKPQPKTLDNMSLEELQAEKNVRIATLNEKQKAVNAVNDGQNENVKAAKANETKAKEEYEKALKEDPGAKKFAKDIMKNNAEIAKNQQALDENAAKILDTELKLSEAESALSGSEGELSALENSLSTLKNDDNNKEFIKNIKSQISSKKKQISKQKDIVKDLKKYLEKLNKEKVKLEKEQTKLEEKKKELDEKVKQYATAETKAKLEAYNQARTNTKEVKSAELAKANAALKTAKASVSEVNNKINEVLKRKADVASNPSAGAQKIVDAAQAELAKGVHETNGNNDSVDIRRYKHGAVNGDQWCAYFTSYCCEQAGHKPFTYTSSSQQIKREAINAGHYAYKNTGYTPKPGDLAMWTKPDGAHGHVGIVEKVYTDGSFDTIEGNSSDSVKRNHYASQSSVGSNFNGFVKMSEWA